MDESWGRSGAKWGRAAVPQTQKTATLQEARAPHRRRDPKAISLKWDAIPVHVNLGYRPWRRASFFAVFQRSVNALRYATYDAGPRGDPASQESVNRDTIANPGVVREEAASGRFLSRPFRLVFGQGALRRGRPDDPPRFFAPPRFNAFFRVFQNAHE